MEEKDIREIRKNVDILLGSVDTHDCDPLQDCDECHGSGDCQKCEGHGKVDCDDCHGSGDCHDCHGHGKDTCQECHGQGSIRCNGCGGTGTCRKCGGSGRITCKHCGGRGQVLYKDYEGSRYVNCHKCNGQGTVKCPDCSGLFTGGSGKCDKCGGSGQLKCKKCDGTGQIVCKHCNGSGKCTKCSGSGKLTCKHCEGSGKCPHCNGTGKITCKRCKGSGWYQTFIKSETTLYAKDWIYVSNNPINEAIGNSTGKTIFEGIYMQWKSANQIEYDKTEETRKICRDYLGDYADKVEEYVSAYDSNNNLKSPAKPNDKPYSRRLVAEAIPVTKIEYTTNGQDYFIYLSGDNHVVSYEQVPTEIKAYSHSFMERVRLALTEKKRMKQYAVLAAYIFQCDGKSIEESRMLNLILKELKLSDSARSKFTEKLNKFDSSMPYEEFRKHIKSLFATKKALSFAWQCMAVDKQVSDEENKLFDQLCSEYQLTENESQTMKNYASRFAKIKDENIIAEYCDISEQSKKYKVLVGLIIGFLILTLVVATGATISSLTAPEAKKSYKKPKTESVISEVNNKAKTESFTSDKDTEIVDVPEDNLNKVLASTYIPLGLQLYNTDKKGKESVLEMFKFKKCGADESDEYWAKECTFNVKGYTVRDTKPSSVLVKFSKTNKDVTITVFDEKIYNEAKKSLGTIGYKRTDGYRASGGNVFDIYTFSSNIYPSITASDESGDGSFPYNFQFSESE